MYNEKTTESQVSLSLTANNINSGTYIARVPHRALDMENIVSDIAASYPALDPYVINHAAELIKQQILSYIKEGKAVNVLELGTLYIATKATVPRDNPQSARLPDLTLRFKPSREAVAALSGVRAASCMVKTSEPSISSVVSLKGGAEAGVLCRGYPVRVAGSNLKVAGDEGGVFFVPQDADGEPDRNEELWIAADTSYLMRNYPKTLEFSLPEELEEGAGYFVAVRTQFCRSGILRKEAVTGFSAHPLAISD